MYLELNIDWNEPPGPRLREDLEIILDDSGCLGWNEEIEASGRPTQWRVYFNEKADTGPTLWAIQNACLRHDVDPPEIRSGLLEEQDWTEPFREHFRAHRVGPCWWVVPPWEADTSNVQKGEEMLIIDPGMAFGTGMHESTQLCLEFLPEYVSKNVDVIDVGAGSGILSIAAAKKGASRIWAIEADPQGESNLRRNLELNVVSDRVEVRIQNVADLKLPAVPVIFCNMIYTSFEAIAPAILCSLAPGGTLIVSGYLIAEREKVTAALQDMGLKIVGEKEKGEWLALALMQ